MKYPYSGVVPLRIVPASWSLEVDFYSPIVLDEGEGFEGEERLPHVLIKEKAESMSAELGLDAGVQA